MSCGLLAGDDILLVGFSDLPPGEEEEPLGPPQSRV